MLENDAGKVLQMLETCRIMLENCCPLLEKCKRMLDPTCWKNAGKRWKTTSI